MYGVFEGFKSSQKLHYFKRVMILLWNIGHMEYDGVGVIYSQQAPRVQEVLQLAFPKKDLAHNLKQAALAPIS